ncbi:extensin family protein [Hyphomicrobium sp.]|uniref:extensin-like domain-containing protein n=1 Tax=Hyphomicrobium sp. TaxID=82 RepID=UPI0025C4988B|nr:extensin family protein [Hyphomicrobium sp.]MCC7252311.1 extensin family protein [Hyphomicrobium sp.]
MKRGEEPIPALSAGLSHVMLTGLLLAVALPVHQPPRQLAPAPAPSAPAADEAPRTPAPPAASPGSAPAPAASSPPSPADTVATEPAKEEWPQSDVVLAREQCMHLLSGTPAEIEYLEPIKKGQCGLPAPVLLKSVGAGPKVVFDPPVQVNCRMVAALGKWAKSTLQPEAKSRFKSEVVRIVGASGYSCRNIYNRPNAKLSQHALANAIDIGGFSLANGRTVRVLRGWGLTARDIKARALAKAEAEAKAKADAKGKASPAKSEVAAKQSDKATQADSADKPARQVTQASLTLSSEKSASREKKAVLTGATPATEAAEPAKPTKESLFLRAIHGGACKEFGTVLGPEANDPHRNHFHLDLIPRRNRGYCE